MKKICVKTLKAQVLSYHIILLSLVTVGKFRNNYRNVEALDLPESNVFFILCTRTSFSNRYLLLLNELLTYKNFK